MTSLQVTISFEEHEARFLGALVDSLAPRLSATQKAIARGIAQKFVAAGQRQIDALVEAYGPERAEQIAQECIDMHPHADLGALA